MVDIFSNLVGLIAFIASVIFLYLDRIANAYSDYSFQEKQYDWHIHYAEEEGNDDERRKNVYLKNQFVTEYGSITKRYIFVVLGIVLALFGFMVLLLNALPMSTQMSQGNENPLSTCQNVTYILNADYYNYSMTQIIVKNERELSVEELKYLMQNRNGHFNHSLSRPSP